MFNNFVTKATNMWVKLVNSIISTNSGNKFVIGSFTDIRANGYKIDNITIVTPYGSGGIPPNNSTGLVMPIEGSNKSYVSVGFGQTIPPCAYIPVAGDSWNNSQNYILFYQSSAIKAAKINNNTYITTLPSGEYVGKLIKDRITEIENIINEVNANYSTLLSWASLVTAALISLGHTEVTPLVQTNLPVPNTLANDTTAITNEYYLINDNGRLP